MRNMIFTIFISGAIISGLLPSCGRYDENQAFAESRCNPSVMGIGSYTIEKDTIKFVRKYRSFDECLSNNFPNGTSVNQLERYIWGAKFEQKNYSKKNEYHMAVYLKNEDYEKGPRELLIVVGYRNGLITNLKGFSWSGSNWVADQIRPKSPFEACLKYIKKCEIAELR